MNNSVLPLDVFHVLMEHATRHTVFNLMQTCHRLTCEGGQYLLSDGVRLRTENDAVSFLSFLSARPSCGKCSRRRTWVRSVALSFGSAPPTQSMIPRVVHSIFTNLSPSANRFRHLEIRNAEKLLTLDPSVDIAYAIGKLTTLDTLSIEDGGRRTLELLGQLQSRLEYAKVSVESAVLEVDLDGLSPDERDARRLFESSAQHLRSLSVHAPLSFSAAGSTYTAIRELSMGRIRPPAVVDYLDAFPHLERLHVFDLVPEAFDADHVDQHRQRNILLRSHHSRTSLLEVCGPIMDLYTLGLQCWADSVRAWPADASWDEDLEEALWEVLEDTQPIHLLLTINDFDILLSEDFCDLCLREPMQRLESFQLHLDMYHYEYRLLNMSAILDAIHEGVRTMTSLRAFKLTISWFALGEFFDSDGVEDDSHEFDVLMRSWEGLQAPPWHEFVLRDFFATWDPKTFVGRLLGASAVLEVVHIDNDGHPPELNYAVEHGSYEHWQSEESRW